MKNMKLKILLDMNYFIIYCNDKQEIIIYYNKDIVAIT